jgi:hypothetical protein
MITIITIIIITIITIRASSMSFLPNFVSNTKADVDVNSGLDSNSRSISPFLNDLMSQDLIVDDMSANTDEVSGG